MRRWKHRRHRRRRHRSQLLTLYVSVLVPILSEWINDEDLCYLDTAVCSRKYRNHFLKAIELSTVSIDWNPLPFSARKSISWLLLRNLSLRRICTSLVDWFQIKCIEEVESLDSKLLHNFFEKFNLTPNIVRLTISESDELVSLSKIGPKVTDLTLQQRLEDVVARSCPNLRRIEMAVDYSFFPFLDHCPHLDSIINCHLHSLLSRKPKTNSYACDLKRTSVMDESAVCLGEGKKYFNLTSLNLFDGMFEEERDMLVPMLKHLTTLHVEYTTIMSAIVSQCYRLTTLKVYNTRCHKIELLNLLAHSPCLRHCTFSDYFDKCNAGPFLAVLPRYCPLLEECSIQEKIKAETLSKFLTECSSLIRLHYFDTFAGHDVSVSCPSGLKSGRHKSLEMRSTEPSHVVKTLVKHHPGISRIVISSNQKGRMLDLTCIDKLYQLKVLQIKYAVDLNLQLPTNNLTSLSLESCSYDPSLLTMISTACPFLTELVLSSNNHLRNEDIVSFLPGCLKLQSLYLFDCKSITASLFQDIKSCSLRHLNVTGTSIAEDEIPSNLSMTVSCFNLNHEK